MDYGTFWKFLLSAVDCRYFGAFECSIDLVFLHFFSSNTRNPIAELFYGRYSVNGCYNGMLFQWILVDCILCVLLILIIVFSFVLILALYMLQFLCISEKAT